MSDEEKMISQSLNYVFSIFNLAHSMSQQTLDRMRISLSSNKFNQDTN